MRHTYGLIFAAVLAACGPDIRMTDDIDLTWDFEITLDRLDGFLHTPYVKGAPVTVFVNGGDDDDLTGWKVSSSDSSVFAIDSVTVADDRHSIAAKGRAVGEGVAGLIVDDKDGGQVGIEEAEVVAPDRVELDAHGYLILNREPEAYVDDVRIVAGGTATYLVRYYRGDRELHGNGVLSIDAPAMVSANPRTTFLFENREWVSVSSSTVGTESIALRADGDPITTVPVITVPETDIQNVALLAQSEKGHEDGDWLVLLAQSSDAIGRRIFGVDYRWNIDGVMQTDAGDLYRYEFKQGAFEMVTAERAGHAASTMIQSDTGFVDTTNHVGCDAGAGAGGFVGLALLGLRRRRRQRRP
jgi:hypothetical protein